MFYDARLIKPQVFSRKSAVKSGRLEDIDLREDKEEKAVKAEDSPYALITTQPSTIQS